MISVEIGEMAPVGRPCDPYSDVSKLYYEYPELGACAIEHDVGRVVQGCRRTRGPATAQRDCE